MNFTLAHFSDLHLGPLPRGAVWSNFRLKRLVGGTSWHMKRKQRHNIEIGAALAADVARANPDHIAFTGDAANISSPLEFPPIKCWIANLAGPEKLSYTPGNHDAYVKLDWERGLGLLNPYMTGDMKSDERFPFVRLRRNIALIGLNSSQPRALHSAQGWLGNEQRERLAQRLRELRAKGFYRLVMIHHPPGVGMTKRLRSLTDAAALTELLCTEGAELVIHGHNHERSLNWLEKYGSRIPVIGVPSASMAPDQHWPAEWNLYNISRGKASWLTKVSIRRWNGATNSFEHASAFELQAGVA